ncbi:DUF4258 domain-containing protein [Candidatus Thiosymbion oneisti]|uniref:DUF4258 domain-containing protein n=1 Tax=Candidatus Thiosymbion oneisti TaxID=589554 RepID=UPI000B7DAF17|nr:DUF4258 domain-containing protein [Candidatus Thiosymbion oneisti]
MNIRFFIDLETDAPHIYRHNVAETDVEEILVNPIEDRSGKGGARISLGRTFSGRFLRVIYVPDAEPNSVFVITAYELKSKPLKALRRRHRRKSK